jgi:pantoate--beta-alanine ligase
MTVVKTVQALQEARSRMGVIGFVPTMGALHSGHLSLVRLAKRYARQTCVSIFVNPTQFGPREDYSKYPRPLEQDLELCRAEGVDLVFAPSAEEIYPPGRANITIDLPELTQTLEGRHRPGHFQGVCQVVAKLFNLVQPQYAVFGQKDFQQLRVLEAMAEALDFPVAVIAGPTLRDADGLALSSRNQYLSADERARALNISRALFAAEAEAKAGAQVTSKLIAIMQRMLLDPGKLGHVPLAIDYVACVDSKTLKPADTFDRPVTCAIAARVGATRLIDNIVIGA